MSWRRPRLDGRLKRVQRQPFSTSFEVFALGSGMGFRISGGYRCFSLFLDGDGKCVAWPMLELFGMLQCAIVTQCAAVCFSPG